MNNKGSVTIFLCLLITAMIILGMSSVKVVEHHMAKAKSAMAVKSAMSSVDAGYNSYIFENYHILLFDKNFDGRGEGALEEQLVLDIKYNLGDSFYVEELGVADYRLILEDDCGAFKEQVADYCSYGLVEWGADKILNSTDNQDGTVDEEILDDMDNANQENQEGNDDTMDAAQTVIGVFSDDTEDPRDYTRLLSSEGILYIVAPEEMEISSEKVNLSGVPSLEKLGFDFMGYEVNNDFDNISTLKSDIVEFDSWKDSLVEGGTGVAYGASVFNCATEQLQEETVYSFELEYIICGRDSDMENLKSVVHRIIGMRMPVNYSYLITSPGKMAEISKISWPIAFATLVPEPIVRYLIAGCWAYVEAIFDVRCLLEGQRMDFIKSDSTWKTDLFDLENSTNLKGDESDKGLCYKDYLLILMALNMDKSYYRMLDIIELNTKQYYKNFDMNNGAVGFTLDAQISYQGRNFFFKESVGY